MANVSIEALSDELVALAEASTTVVQGRATQAFEGRTFDVVSLDEVGELARNFELPACAVAYDGTTPTDTSKPSSGRASQCALPTAVEHRFYVIVVVDYNGSAVVQTGRGVNTKFVATALLDVLAGKIDGHTGVNDRPWRFLEQGPAPFEVNGVVMYIQSWATTAIINRA